jgi:hypothetical protein
LGRASGPRTCGTRASCLRAARRQVGARPFTAGNATPMGRAAHRRVRRDRRGTPSR